VNAAGNRLSVNSITKGSARIDLSSLPPGVYNVVFENDGVISSVQKVVKQ
jgi:hypothetical protein